MSAASLYRNRDRVHRDGCRYVKEDAQTWLWAVGKTRRDALAAVVNGLQFCKICDPLRALPDQPDASEPLSTDDVLELAALHITPLDIVRLRWPDASDDKAEFVLWELTPFPLISGIYDLIDAVAAAPEPDEATA